VISENKYGQALADGSFLDVEDIRSDLGCDIMAAKQLFPTGFRHGQANSQFSLPTPFLSFRLQVTVSFLSNAEYFAC
jgi:hypothetical protein